MRSEGSTTPEIAKELHVSKSSVSSWVRDVPIPQSLIDRKIASKKKHGVRLGQISALRKGIMTKRPHQTIDGVLYLWCYRCKCLHQKDRFRYGKNGTSPLSWCRESSHEFAVTRWKQMRKKVVDLLGGRCDCGCDIESILDIHHAKWDGDDDRSKKCQIGIWKEMLKMNRIDLESRYRLKCRPCHMAEHLSRRMGLQMSWNIKWTPN